jgi:NAD-dependent dihydropyrimidine dehydrogenase PreA subunit
MVRDIIVIDEEKCNGCGLCVPNCPEGALQVIDGKVRLISDLLCDGLGACVGECPQGALKVEKKDVGPYDEKKAMENIIKAGTNTIKAHLKHLYDHNQKEYLEIAINVLKEKNIQIPDYKDKEIFMGGCPGSRIFDFREENKNEESGSIKISSQLRQWPIQLHLISPEAPYYQKADLLLAADCTAFAYGNFHNDYLKGKSIAIACPKLDENQEVYIEKIKDMIEISKINTITVLIMQVPCCRGLLKIAQEAREKSSRKIPIKYIVISLKGDILEEEWI